MPAGTPALARCVTMLRMDHSYQDRVSLELARMIAAELTARPEWIAKARDNLDRWSRFNAGAPSLLRCYDEWRALLDLPVAEVCAVLTAETDEGQRLRQNSPFPGVIPFVGTVLDVKRRIREQWDPSWSYSARPPGEAVASQQVP
jgi:hypothetical protein